jgi:hypothetical protein
LCSGCFDNQVDLARRKGIGPVPVGLLTNDFQHIRFWGGLQDNDSLVFEQIVERRSNMLVVLCHCEISFSATPYPSGSGGDVISNSTVLAGDTMVGSGIDRLGRLTGSVPFGRVDQQLQIKAANPCP